LPALAVGDAQGGGVLRQRAALASDMAALYWPWISSSAAVGGAVPPCGHVAGIVARTDRDAGPHRAPANLPLEAAVDLQAVVTTEELGRLNAAGVNALRATPGRGIRIWGAYTLSPDPAYRHIGVRRLTIAVERWSRNELVEYAFAPNDPALWRRIQLAIGVRLDQLFRDGALAGSAPAEAFYVKCDAQTTPPEEREAGRVIAEVGLAPTVPNEFIVVQIVRDASGAAAAPA
jgi:phage tail sheath protein FI